MSDQILSKFNRLSDTILRKHVHDLGPTLVELSVCENQEVRVRNKVILARVFDLLIVDFKV